MSAIGGIVHPEQKRIDGGRLIEMSRSMMLRGKETRGAYINGGLGILHNQMPDDSREEIRQPFSLARNGKIYTVTLDGFLRGCGKLKGVSPEALSVSSAEFALECYLNFGTEFASMLDGDFALAIFDEYHNEVILTRDRNGRRPLFYAFDEKGLVFASEIKAVLRSMGTARIDLGRLRTHISSPVGAYSGDSLYRDIYSIPSGHCGLYSRLGMNLFAYGAANTEEGSEKEKKPSPELIQLSGAVSFADGDLERILTEALFAFDYPQFDHLMPSFFHMLEREAQKKNRRTVLFEDGTLCMNIDYALERADRLGMLKGIRAYGEAPDRVVSHEKRLKSTDRALREILDRLDTDEKLLLTRLFGEQWQEDIRREKNAEKRIRMQGMLYQCVVWDKNYNLLFV